MGACSSPAVTTRQQLQQLQKSNMVRAKKKLTARKKSSKAERRENYLTRAHVAVPLPVLLLALVHIQVIVLPSLYVHKAQPSRCGSGGNPKQC